MASSGVGPCDVPFRYGNQHPAVARWHAHPLRARCAPLSPASGFPVSSRSLRSAQSRKRVPSFFALAALRSVPQAGSQFRGLATAIHEISGLKLVAIGIDSRKNWQEMCISSYNLEENRSLTFGPEWMAGCSRLQPYLCRRHIGPFP
jgi:hypothetical protein